MRHRMLADRVMLCSTRLRSAIAGPPARRGRSDCDFSSRLPRPALHKKTTIRSTNGVRIEGRVMVHRTDIAGSNMGQASSGNGAMCRRAERRLPEDLRFARTSDRFTHPGGKNDCSLLMAAARSLRAVYPKPLAR